MACGVALGANRTNEHVIAEWLLRELEMSEEELTQIAANSITGEMKNSRPPHPMDAFKEGRICARCNSGWMSELESQAQAILPQFMRGQPVTSVTEADSLIIARWTLKTAVVLSHAIGAHKTLPPEHLRFLRANPVQMQSRVGIFAAITQPTRQFGCRQRNHWMNVHLEEKLDLEPHSEIMTERAYKVSFQLRHLLLMAAYIPLASSQFLLAAGLHVPIWSNRILPCYRTDLTIEPPYDSIKVLALFNDSLGAIHTPDEIAQS